MTKYGESTGTPTKTPAVDVSTDLPESGGGANYSPEKRVFSY